MTSDYTNLTHPTEYGGTKLVTVGNGNTLKIASVGNIVLTNGKHLLNLKNILHVPDIAKNLVSVSKLAKDNNVFVEFHEDYCLVKDKGSEQTVLKGTLKDGLYHLEETTVASHGAVPMNFAACPLKEAVNINKENEFALSPSRISINSAVTKTTSHRRLGHSSSRIFDLITKGCNISFKSDATEFCHACQLGKSHRLPFSSSESRALKAFELIHTDVWGPAPMLSSAGFRYYVLFLDDFSRYV